MSPTPADPASVPASSNPAARRARRGLGSLLLRLLFSGKRSLVTLPVVLLGAWLAWTSGVYFWYRGVSVGERTGVIVKVARKGTPLCRYASVEMRVGQQPGTAVLGTETWEFTVDSEHDALMSRLEEAERKQEVITVNYRQDSQAMDAKPPPPNNLPWRFCVTTSYHAIGVIGQK